MTHILIAPQISISSIPSEEAAALAGELGLAIQVKRYRKASAEKAFQNLTNDEMVIWSSHCPTRYASGEDLTRGYQPLSGYAFDIVPIEVMRHWKSIKDNYAFDRYEIWTTEKTKNTDPLLLGTLGPHLFLLARWGLESPGQLSLTDIAKSIYDRFLVRAEQDAFNPFLSKKNKLKSQLEYYRQQYQIFASAERIVLAIK